MDLRQLEQFVAVADTRSFSRAAERLFMAQPPLSVAIRKLEDEVGVALFDRGPRGVMLTAAGQAALGAAVRCLASARDVAIAAQAAANGETGTLRVGFIGSLTFSLLPTLIQHFRGDHPQVRLELSESTNEGLLGMIESKAHDVAFVREPTTHPAHLTFMTVADDVFCVAMPAHHPLARQRKVRLKDLRDQDLIGYTPSRVGGLHAAVMHLLHDANLSVKVAQEAVQVQTVVGLVRSGLGIALVPSINAEFMPNDVVFRPIADLPASSRIGIALAYHEQNANPVLPRFVRNIQDTLQLESRRR